MAFIKEMLPYYKRIRKYDLRTICNAVMYIVKAGCQWRMQPYDFPKWQLVYYYYSRWSEEGVIEYIMDKVRELARKKLGKQAQPTVGIIDSQSVRSNFNRALKGFDGNKKIKGRKRHIIVDTNGWLLAVMVHAVNLHVSVMASLLIKRLKENLFGIKLIFADGGYR